MDTAGINEPKPTGQHARDIESSTPSSEQKNNEEPETSRWWFASTASPLLAATLGPIASGFNICALVSYWRSGIFPGTAEEFGIDIPDPPWLLVVNSLSLLAAIVANTALLLNMGKRMKFSTAQPITITGFILAGGLLVVCMAVLTSSPTLWIYGRYAEPALHALTSAFYFAIFATFLYFIVGALMCITVYGAGRGYYEKDFQLSASQRTLMIQTMVFVTYLLIGALVFSQTEGWTYLQAVYFTDVTLLTIGLGDFAPVTTLGRALFIPFAMIGILIVGLVVSSIRSLVLERARQNIATQIGKNRRSAAINDVRTGPGLGGPVLR
nr:outward-rectifier potassium channel tok1 [Quercus suber]